MSHMVIHRSDDGNQYRQFDDLGSAVQFVEEQHNAGVEGVALFELREIPLEVTSYIKVEVAEVAPAVDATPVAPVAEAPVVAETPAVEAPPAPPAPPLMDMPEPVAAPTPIDDISYVEAAMASPIDAFANEAPPLSDLAIDNGSETPAPASEGRRGLFGR